MKAPSVVCPVCRHAVSAREAVLDDGGAYHQRCLNFGPTCALCAKAIAPGTDTMRLGYTTFHAKCCEAFGWAAPGSFGASSVPASP